MKQSVMVWVSHSNFPQSLLSRSLHHSSQDDHLRLIKPAVFKTSVHNQPSSDCLLTYVSVRLHDFHVSHSSCTYLCSLSGSLENSIIITIISLTWTLVSTQVSTASQFVFSSLTCRLCLESRIVTLLDLPRPRLHAPPLVKLYLQTSKAVPFFGSAEPISQTNSDSASVSVPLHHRLSHHSSLCWSLSITAYVHSIS